MARLVRNLLVITWNAWWLLPATVGGLIWLALSIGGVSSVQDLPGTAGWPVVAIALFIGCGLLIAGLACGLVGSILALNLVSRHQVTGRPRLYAWLMVGTGALGVAWLAVLVALSASGALTVRNLVVLLAAPCVIGALTVPVQLVLWLRGCRRQAAATRV